MAMSEPGRTEEHAHPTVEVYLRVAAALVVLTVLEVGVFYVPAFRPVLVPVLLVLYVYWGGLRAPRRRVAAFAAALLVLGLALNGPLHNLSDSYLFSAHM